MIVPEYFVPKHIAEFKRCFDCPPASLPVEGKNPRRWFGNVDRSRLDAEVGPLPETVNRETLMIMASNPEVRTLDLCISILAWGGMRDNHRDLLFGRPPKSWLEIACRVRGGELARSDAYDAFAGLRSRNELPGMGPAYFTKLIFFLSSAGPKPKGYIMDQWVACSVNLLRGRPIVKLDQIIRWRRSRGRLTQTVDSIVSDFNAGEEYEVFCRSIETLSDEMGPAWRPDLTELALIAAGGRTPHPWREYVISERLTNFCLTGR